MNSTLIKTKILIPQLHSNLVARPRLINQIEDGVQRGNRLTLIAAPAGFGKTTVMCDWVQQSQNRVAWLSLEEGDDESTLFLNYLISSIRMVIANFCDNIFNQLLATPPPSIQGLLPEIVNEIIELESLLVIVLDDYHTIANQEIHDSLTFLLEHQPKNLHLVVCTRADPPIPIGKLRAQRRLTELRASDLRFTEDEAQALLNNIMKLNLSIEETRLLETRTEGWGVGLLLAAQSLQGNADRTNFIASFSGSHHFILEYLVEEVLKHQPNEIRKFLLQTSILEGLSGNICAAVTGNNHSQEIIQHLNKVNMFVIPLDQEQIWFRYHHLFRDLLISFLKKEFEKKDVNQLYRLASRWYFDSKEYEKAIKYALNGQDYEQAVEVIELIVDQVIARGHIKTLLGWLDMVPKTVVNTRPSLLMHYGWIVFLSGKVDQSSEILHQAKFALTTFSNETEKRILHGRLSAMIATITALTRDISGAKIEAHEALSYLSENDFIYQARAMRVLGVCSLFDGELDHSITHLEKAKYLALKANNKFLASEILSQIATVRKHQGQLSQAYETYQAIVNLCEHPDSTPPACLGYIGMADISLEWNNLDKAKEYLDKGIELCQKGNIGYALQPAYLIGGLLNCVQGNHIQGLKTIRKGEELSRMGGGSLESIMGLTWFMTRFNLIFGDVKEANDWVTGKLLPMGRSFIDLPVILNEMHQSLLARVYLKAGKFDEVLKIYDNICDQAEIGNRMARVIELNLFKAVALRELGRVHEAHLVFEKYLELAKTAGNIRLFLEVGEPLKDLLFSVKGNDNNYVQKLIEIFTDQYSINKSNEKSSSQNKNLVESLTRRELEVLHLMCSGYSNKSIADEMIVSVNTIKKHTSNIYSKLGVLNRAQAVLRASELNLI